MSDLPFTHPIRPIRDCGPPTKRGVFDGLTCHSPLNQQVAPTRSIQTGTFRSPDLKTPVRHVDARTDQICRNRENLFFDPQTLNLNISQSITNTSTRSFSPPTARRLTTRHDHTPYDYSTDWISHPSRDTSIAAPPTETFKTSYLVTPNSDMDKRSRVLATSQKYDSLRHNQQHFHEYIATIDDKKKSINERNTRNIRRQRNDYIDALAERRSHEHAKIFE